MPLPKAKGHSKKAIQKQVSKNFDELYHHGTRPRSREQMLAIAYATAEGKNSKRKKKKH